VSGPHRLDAGNAGDQGATFSSAIDQEFGLQQPLEVRVVRRSIAIVRYVAAHGAAA